MPDEPIAPEIIPMSNMERLQEDLRSIAELVRRAVENPAMYEYLTGRDFEKYHEKRVIEVSGQRGDIDVEIIPLIEELWRRGFVTTASCQGGGGTPAYIQFLSAQAGGDWFAEAMRDAGLAVTVSPHTLGFPIPIEDGAVLCKVNVELVAVNATFHPDLMRAVTEAVRRR
jgi:hypothetical protein